MCSICVLKLGKLSIMLIVLLVQCIQEAGGLGEFTFMGLILVSECLQITLVLLISCFMLGISFVQGI